MREAIKEKGLQDQIKIILTVHDEIVCEADEDKASIAEQLLVSSMEDAAYIWVKDVPIVVDSYIDNHWKK